MTRPLWSHCRAQRKCDRHVSSAGVSRQRQAVSSALDTWRRILGTGGRRARLHWQSSAAPVVQRGTRGWEGPQRAEHGRRAEAGAGGETAERARDGTPRAAGLSLADLQATLLLNTPSCFKGAVSQPDRLLFAGHSVRDPAHIGSMDC